MSTKTYFKRISLAVVVALGFGMMSSPTSSAATVGETLTISSATASISAGDTATTSITSTATLTASTDSLTVRTSCISSSPSGVSCPAIQFYWTATPDSTTATSIRLGTGLTPGSGNVLPQVNYTRDSFVIATSNAGSAVSFTSSAKVVTTTSTTPATYTYTVYTMDGAGGSASATNQNKTVTFAVTVSAANTSFTSVRTYITESAAQSDYWLNTYTALGLGIASAKDSAVVVDRGSTTSANLSAAAYVNLWALNSAGETVTSTGLNICKETCAVTAILTGAGSIALGSTSTLARTSAVKAVTMNVNNKSAAGVGLASDDTLTVYADGTVGTGTVTFYNGAINLGSVSVTFTGPVASISFVSLTDTTIAVGQTSPATYVYAYAKDSGGNQVTTGAPVFLFSSDTKVATGAMSTSSAQYTQLAAGLRSPVSNSCTYNSDLALHRCTVTGGDTGTATLTVRDSWTVAASTATSSELTLTVLGNNAASMTVAFDKATYNVGDRATITLTAKDLKGNAVSNGTAGTAFTFSKVEESRASGAISSVVSTAGANTSATSTQFKGYAPAGAESGVETRVVTMPTSAGDYTLTFTWTPASVDPNQLPITATATVKIVDPLEAVIKTQVDAAKAEAAAATAAADAATDAALQAIDAALAASIA